jgi:hypothetical protein
MKELKPSGAQPFRSQSANRGVGEGCDPIERDTSRNRIKQKGLAKRGREKAGVAGSILLIVPANQLKSQQLLHDQFLASYKCRNPNLESIATS